LRRVTSIAEVGVLDEDGEVVLCDIFAFERTGTADDGRILGAHRATGYVPTFLDEFVSRGLVRDGGYL
jgi:pilus assembly protein CpaF